MGEKRKPDYVWLLKKHGKKNLKIELFDSVKFGFGRVGRSYRKKYRIRVNGKWHGEDYALFTKWEFRDILFKTLDF